MARRTGVTTLQNLAQKMCRLITAFSPVIMRVYPESTGVQTALGAARAACETLYEELETIREYGD